MKGNNKMAKLLVNLNELGIFSGCYETLWLSGDTDCDEIAQMESDLNCEVDSELDFNKYLKSIAETYESYLENEFGGTFLTYEIYSPKYYNFETDNITLVWEKENLSENQMQKLLDDKFDGLEDSELNDIETYDIYDGFNGYEIYQNMVQYYTMDGKEIYYNENGKYVTE